MRFALVLAAGFALPSGAIPQTATNPAYHWVGSWAASQQVPELRNKLPAQDARGVTLRQVVHLSLGGAELRVRLSNAFGTAPLQIGSVHIAHPRSAESSSIEPGSDRTLTFDGRADITIPAGAEYVSDPVSFAAAPLSNLAVSIYLAALPAQETGHPGSRATSYLMDGNQTAAPTLPDAKPVDHWYQLSGIDVEAPIEAASIVTLGDSITDGHASTVNGNDRWPDVLARRLQANRQTRERGVLNAGIGGNRLLLDGLGPNAVARLNRDVLAAAGVRYLIVLEGINDLGTLTLEGDVSPAAHKTLVQNILTAYGQIIARAHSKGITVLGGTIMPDGCSAYYHPGAASEEDRQDINRWIRASRHFDAVIDFDQVMRDPAHPNCLLAGYDSGDHLHPSPAGYRAMGDAIPLGLFNR